METNNLQLLKVFDNKEHQPIGQFSPKTFHLISLLSQGLGMFIHLHKDHDSYICEVFSVGIHLECESDLLPLQTSAACWVAAS